MGQTRKKKPLWNVLHKPSESSSLPAVDRASTEKKQHADSRHFILAARGLPLIHTSYIYPTHGLKFKGHHGWRSATAELQISHCVSDQLPAPIMSGRVTGSRNKLVEMEFQHSEIAQMLRKFIYLIVIVQVSWCDQNLGHFSLAPPGGHKRHCNITQTGNRHVIKKYKFIFSHLYKGQFTQVL